MGRLRFWLVLSVLPALFCHIMAVRRAARDGFRMTGPALALLLAWYSVGVHFCFVAALGALERRLDYDDVLPAATAAAALVWYLGTLLLLRKGRALGMLGASYRYLCWRGAMLLFLTPEFIWLEQAVWSLFGGGPQ